MAGRLRARALHEALVDEDWPRARKLLGGDGSPGPVASCATPDRALGRKLREEAPPGDCTLDPRHPLANGADPPGGVRLRVFLSPDPYLHQQIQAVTRHALDLIRG